MRGNWLSNRVFQSYTNIVDHCCDTWNKLIAQPWTITCLSAFGIGPMGSDQRALVLTSVDGTWRKTPKVKRLAFSCPPR